MLALCEQLADAIAVFCGDRPKVNDEWHRDMDRLLRLDKRDPDKVAAVIAFAFGRDDAYWPPHLAAPHKLRKHWQTLTMQLTRDAKVVSMPGAAGQPGAVALIPPTNTRRQGVNLGTDQQDAEIQAFLNKRGAQQ